MPPQANLVRIAGRFALAAVVLGVLAVVAVQFAGIVAKNVAVAGELAASRAQIESLHERAAAQRRTISRLGDPAGAIPEIHDKLRLVGPNEELIYVRGLPQASAAPRWDETP
jgi:cell division protein FtsB